MERNSEEVVSVSAKENKKRLCDDNVITSEILSRLPLKSLLRFKCVCKRWQFIIQKDKFFIDMHLSRSKATRNCSLLHVGAQCANHRIRLLSLELYVPSEDDVRVQVRNKREWKPRFRDQPIIHICSLDGLICLMNKENNNVRICNVSTRESTPWIESSIDEQDELVTSVFGYDHATKEYKVLALWKLSDYGFVCEVLTVRRNSWRRIPLISISPYHVSSVHVNGSIYLLCSEVWNRDITKTYVYSRIAEFNVHTEKFRIVETTSYSAHMMDLDGRLCLLTYDTQGKTRRSIKMRALYDHGEDVQDKKSTTTPSISSDAGSSNFV